MSVNIVKGEVLLNSRFLMFIKNILYSLSSNLVSLLISSLVVLIVPKLISIEEYGYWQLYLFYASYVGFLHFGWNDGIYLRYGGKNYKDLDMGLFFSQFWMLSFSQLIIAVIIGTASAMFVINSDRQFIFIMVAICMLIVNVRYMLLFILQGTNRIKEYAQITIIEKVLYCLLIILFLLEGVRQFKLLIVADLIGKSVAFIYSVYCCKELVFRKISVFYFSMKEMIDNINVGIKLMFANIASILIIGIVRFGIERIWDVATFGKVSLTLSVSGLMMIFVNAVGIIMFPMLRRTDPQKLPRIYITMRTLLMTSLFGILIVYYPLKVILSAWLPKYAESLMFMAIVFPMCIYEGKMSLLINTYLKTLRKEKLLLYINMVTVILSIILTLICTVVMHKLILSVMSIVVLLAFRCILAEILLSRILNISIYKEILLEITMSFIFISTGWLVNSWIGIGIYLAALVTYFLVVRNDIIVSLNNVKVLVRRQGTKIYACDTTK